MSELLAPADPLPAMLDAVKGGTGVPVSSRVPNPRPKAFVRIISTGGSGRTSKVRWSSTFAYEAWAATAPAARDLAYEARAELLGLEGTVSGDVAFYRVRDVAAPGSLPDPESGQERMTGSVEVVCRESPIT